MDLNYFRFQTHFLLITVSYLFIDKYILRGLYDPKHKSQTRATYAYLHYTVTIYRFQVFLIVLLFPFFYLYILFVIYLTTLSGVQPVQRRILG
jgi:hypothetical protein